MQFNSIEFLFCFLPAFLIVYAVFPKSFRGTILVLGSFLYYAFASNGNYWWLAILFVFMLFGFCAGLCLHRWRKRALLWAFCACLTGVLLFFKIFQNGKLLPPGMSFYMFQISAYLIDVYTLRSEPERQIIPFAGQIVMFPKLLSGPLLSTNEMRLLRNASEFNSKNLRDGLQMLVLGLGLKVLLANRLGGLWSSVGIAGYDCISVPLAWLSLIAYAMQLYFDFYGYSLMAMGLGKMLGFDLPKNFDSPYASKTVSEFYRRWHITLGRWFREYIYIPLGGNRKGTMYTIFNLAVVWGFTGLWHGIGGNYLIWAGFLFLLIVNERLWFGKLLNRTHIISRVYVVVVILLSWVPFAVGDWNQMISFFGRLFGLSGMTANSRDYLVTCADYGLLMAAGVLFATPLPEKIWNKIRNTFLADVLILILFWCVVAVISTAAQDPFLYFQY